MKPVWPVNTEDDECQDQENYFWKYKRLTIPGQYYQRPIGNQQDQKAKYKWISVIKPEINRKTMPDDVEKTDLEGEYKHCNQEHGKQFFLPLDFSVQEKRYQ